MKSRKIQFKTGTVIELSFATVIPGKEAQVFSEYFPKVMPIVLELGGQPLGSFAISEAESRLGSPKMGALFQWPNLGVFKQLHVDPRFLAIKGIRDDAMEFFSNGHFFVVQEDTEVTFQEDENYVLMAHWQGQDHSAKPELLNFLTLATAPDQSYQPERISISRWEGVQHNNTRSNNTDIYKFTLNFPA